MRRHEPSSRVLPGQLEMVAVRPRSGCVGVHSSDEVSRAFCAGTGSKSINAATPNAPAGLDNAFDDGYFCRPSDNRPSP
jgi:hypothetical protein